jgi:aryl-alcohol dehydrogenase-like predicted oxidoreductase
MSSSPIISAIGLGTSNIASLGKRLSPIDAINLFNCALENNVKLIDTANTYGSGDAERLIAKGISGRRKDFTLMTKAGFPFVALPGFLSPLNQVGKKILQKCNVKKNYSKEYLINSLYGSLKRLRTDHVDSFLLHEPLYHELIHHDDCWEALYQIKKSGMAVAIGMSTNDNDAFFLGFNNIELDLVQTSMPYFIKNSDSSVFYSCKEKGIPVVANQVLKPAGYLKNNLEFIGLLGKYNQTLNDIVPILIAYSKDFMNSDCVLIGTRNPGHLIQNSTKFNLNDDLTEIFEFIKFHSL